jgi:hypothetical protein
MVMAGASEQDLSFAPPSFARRVDALSRIREPAAPTRVYH